jgi:hypothetical protein
VRSIGCAGCLRDLRDSAQSHIPYIAQRMMTTATTAMSCRLEGESGDRSGNRPGRRRGVCFSKSEPVILLEGAVE